MCCLKAKKNIEIASCCTTWSKGGFQLKGYMFPCNGWLSFSMPCPLSGSIQWDMLFSCGVVLIFEFVFVSSSPKELWDRLQDVWSEWWRRGRSGGVWAGQTGKGSASCLQRPPHTHTHTNGSLNHQIEQDKGLKQLAHVFRLCFNICCGSWLCYSKQ